MRSKDFEKQMRAFESFHAMRVPPDSWIVLRLDGRCFSTYTEKYKKPFDEALHMMMCNAAKKVVTELGAVFAYVESDEVSVLLPKESALFDREVEKLCSVSASIMSSSFSMLSNDFVSFDSRVIVLPNTERLKDYFQWRQADAVRNGLNTYAYWALRYDKKTKKQASRILENKGKAFKNELLFKQGINFNDVPEWTKRGSAIKREFYWKDGFNPVIKQVLSIRRSRFTIDHTLPENEEYNKYVESYALCPVQKISITVNNC